MTTRSSLTSVAARRLALLVVGIVLVSAGVVPVATSSLPCRAASAVAATQAAVSSAHERPASRGVDLELRVLNLRVEFPWLKSLPVTPGHRIVISWMATNARE